MKLRAQAKWVGVIATIMSVALVCAFYILSHERVRSPFAKSYEVRAEFDNVAGAIPGIGEPVTVAGVHVGQIAKIDLVGERALVTLRMEPDKLPALHTGARATLVANTPAKDMQIALRPGDPHGPKLKDGATIPLAATTTPVDADELLRSLDGDTRTWLKSLIGDLGTASRGRGKDLRSLLRTLGPTTGQVHQISSLLAGRRYQLRRLVHNIRVLSGQAATQSSALSAVVSDGDSTLHALASQDANLGKSLELLPGTLSKLNSTLVDSQPFSRTLRTSLTALRPTLRRLPTTVHDLPDFLQGLTPLPLKPLAQFTKAAGPLGANVRSASADIGNAIPPLTTSMNALTAAANALTYQEIGGPQSYLFWFSWFAHNANSMLSTEDAQGAAWRGLALTSCDSLSQPGAIGDVLRRLIGSPGVCAK